MQTVRTAVKTITRTSRAGSNLYPENKLAGPRDYSNGFTLIEIIVVVTIISILFLLVTPRLSRFMSDEGDNFALFTGIIAKTFDDSFLNDRVNYLVIHLNEPNPDDAVIENDIFQRSNGISVVTLEKGEFIDSENKLLRHRSFPDSFVIEEVLLQWDKKITRGNALVPFYPQGYSDNIIIHVLVNDEDRWSVRIYRNIKEPAVQKEYVTFEDE